MGFLDILTRFEDSHVREPRYRVPETAGRSQGLHWSME